MIRKHILASALMLAALAPGMSATARNIPATMASTASVKGTKGREPSNGGGRVRRSRGRSYPFSSTRQDARHAARQYMKHLASGLSIMQTMSRARSASVAGALADHAQWQMDGLVRRYGGPV